MGKLFDRQLAELSKAVSLETLNKQDRIFYVYALMDTAVPGPWHYRIADRRISFPFLPFYIGKGKGNRKDSHVRDALAGRGKTAKSHKIRKVYNAGYTVEVATSRKLYLEAEALALEILLIETIGRRDIGHGPLTNLADGGEGPSGCKRTFEQNQANRERGLARWNSLSFEEKAKVSQSTVAQFSRMTDAQKQARAMVISHASKSVHASRTQIEHSAWVDRITNTHWSKDPEKRTEVTERMSATWSNKSEAEMDNRLSKWKGKMTPAVQELRALKIRAEYAARSPEQKAARAAKISATRLRKFSEIRQAQR
jgi:hypothetical protein